MTEIERVLMSSLAVMATACVGDDRPPAEAAAIRTAGWTDLAVVPYVPAAHSAASREAATRPLVERSREEVAEALRPVILKGDGRLYIASEPAWEAADALDRGGFGPSDELRADQDEPDPARTARIFGTDDRLLVSNTAIAPFSAIARVEIFLDSGLVKQCTGSYVGPWTFILAGHCLRQPNGTVARRIAFEPASNGSTLPFGGFTCRNDDADTSNDYLAAIPSGFVTNAADKTLDFAVIDTYPCHSAPRWFGQPATNQGITVDPAAATYYLHGYPIEPCPGASSGLYFMCGMAGSAYVNGSWFESSSIDDTDGQSGGPWHRNGRVAATHIGFRQYHDFFRCGFDACLRSYARRIDGTYKAFLDAIAFDYP